MKHETPEGAFSPMPTQENLAESLRELLECYWGAGDGDEPPEMIRKAQTRLDLYQAERSAQ